MMTLYSVNTKSKKKLNQRKGKTSGASRSKRKPSWVKTSRMQWVSRKLTLIRQILSLRETKDKTVRQVAHVKAVSIIRAIERIQMKNGCGSCQLTLNLKFYRIEEPLKY